MNEAAREKLDTFDTFRLLVAVDALDGIRRIVADQDNARPPQIRIDLLKLHKIAYGAINEGQRLPKETGVYSLADELASDAYQLTELAGRLTDTLQGAP